MEYNQIHLGQKVMKVVIIMTDGDFNTIYHDGVIAKNSTGGGASGSSGEKINENGTNGSSFAQAEALCTNMRSEEHTSELQSLMRISYAVFCLKKKNTYYYRINKNKSISYT